MRPQFIELMRAARGHFETDLEMFTFRFEAESLEHHHSFDQSEEMLSILPSLKHLFHGLGHLVLVLVIEPGVVEALGRSVSFAVIDFC